MRVVLKAAVMLALAACTSPENLVGESCGNGVVDPGEDCEHYAGEMIACTPPDPAAPANGCRFACDFAKASTVQCPKGESCASTGVCAEAEGVCGNGILEPGEDCELGIVTPGTTCAPPHQTNECRYTCDATNTTTAQCPSGSVCLTGGLCSPAPNTCGNGQLDPGEDCEPTLSGSGVCATVAPNACHYVCSSTVTCPTGGCGSDGRCRVAAGVFVEAPQSPFVGQSEFVSIGDFNGDHVTDIVTAQEFVGAQIAYGAAAHDGTFPTSVTFPVEYSGQLGIGDFDGDGRQDLAFDSFQGAFVMRGQNDGTLVSITTPTFFPPISDSSGFDTADFLIPMRPDATQPFQEILHISIGSDQASLSFDQSFGLVGSLPGDPSPLPPIPGAHSAFNSAGPVQFPVADLTSLPAIGGDEIAIGFSGETVVHLYTATNGSGSTGPHLTAQRDLAWPGPLESPPMFADMNGDGNLDVAARMTGSDGNSHLAVSNGNGRGTFSAAQVDSTLDEFFVSAVVNLSGDARAEIISGREILTRGSGGLIEIGELPGFVFTTDLAFPDLNRDGFRDVVAPTTNGLDIAHGGASGIFNPAFVPTPGTPAGLRTGDFDGDRVDDVLFVIQNNQSGESDLYVMYGTTSGLPSPPAKIAEWPTLLSAEPVLLGRDQSTSLDSVTDVVAETVESNLDASPGTLAATLLQGDASRSLLSIEELNLQLPAVLGGHFVPGQSRDALFLPAQAGTIFSEFALFEYAADGGEVSEQDVGIDSFSDPTGFDANTCTLYARGDLDGDKIDDVVAVHSCDPSQSPSDPATHYLFLPTLNASVPPQTGSDGSTFQPPLTTSPVPISTNLTGVQRISLSDVDHDGHLDVVAVFAGDPTTPCTMFPCVNTNSGVLVMFGDGAGAFPQVAALANIDGAGQPLDAAALDTDGDPALEIAVATNTGIFVYDLQPDRTFVATSPTQPTIPLSSFSTVLAATDLDEDGISDLIVDDSGNVHVFLGVAASH